MADARTLFTLLETAAGYGLFEVIAFEEIASMLEDNSLTVTDYGRFAKTVKLKAFQPFETAQEALENANAVAEHVMSETLHNFLEMNLPRDDSGGKKSTKVAPFALGVIDPALATSITDKLTTITCRSDDTVREILRGCRLHLDIYIKGLASGEGGSASGGEITRKAQLGLGHSFSRSRVQFNPARSDNMIIQSIALLDQLDKDVNTFAMRVREWYSWHFPELRDIVKDNIMFARAAAYIQDKNSLLEGKGKGGASEGGEEDDDEDDEEEDGGSDPGGRDAAGGKFAGLVEVVGDEEMAKSVVAAARTSMGMDCSPVDMINIVNFTQRMVKLAEYRKQLSMYLTDKMSVVAPNLSALIGDSVAARLISKAGSLTNLAKAPASTVQILGAEKALFRALKTKGNTPKYGLIYHSTFIGRADAKNKGRISRYLANKCSIASRIDSFSDSTSTPTRLYGEKLRDQVEERLKFYETGQAPRRNIDVMEEVSKELKAAATGDGMDVDDDDDEKMEVVETPKKDKKKKDKKDKKKKKRKAEDMDESDDDEEEEDKEKSAKKKSSKKAKKDKVGTPKSSSTKDEAATASEKKKKKKKKSKED